MSVIGEQIKKYRTGRDITQERLGELIGVTTQAVSRWERGGTPDAELLPVLSEVLGVSIDALFGREEKSISLTLARRLSQMPQEEAFRYAFNMCWAIEIGLLGDTTAIDDFLKSAIEHSFTSESKSTDHFAKVILDGGMATARMSPEFSDFFMIVDSKDNLRNHLSDLASIRDVFSIFADEKLLNIICFLYSMPDIAVSTSLISKNTGVEIKDVDRCMDVLCENNLATRSVVATADGDINSYFIRRESYAVPLLCIADELSRKGKGPVIGKYDRKKPLL